MKQLFHRHSTFFGFAAAAVFAIAIGELTHWLWVLVTFAAIAGILFFPRAFYGRAASRALDEAPATPGSFLSDQEHRVARDLDMADISTNASRLYRAYDELRCAEEGGYDEHGRLADPNALRSFAEEERQ